MSVSGIPSIMTDIQPGMSPVIVTGVVSGTSGLEIENKTDEGYSLSNEQQELVNAFESGNNVICDAVAGSGKSTTLLYLSRMYPRLTFLFLTYNRDLVNDCRRKLKSGGIVNCSVHTYHSAMSELYDTQCTVPDDIVFGCKLAEIHQGNIPYMYNGLSVIICDEAQDIRGPYLCFVKCILRDQPDQNPQIIISGASEQLLYNFFYINPADRRFLTLADKLLPSKRQWSRVVFSHSYRLTPNIARYVNIMMQSQLVKGINTKVPNNKVQYVMCDLNSMGTYDYIYNNCISNSLMLGESVVMLFPSIRNRRYRRVVNHFINRYDLKITVQGQDNNSPGHVRVCSYHGFKGLESHCVILFGCHDSVNDKPRIPNALHVALTRCSGGKLCVIHHYTQPFVPYCSQSALQDESVNFIRLCTFRPMKYRMNNSWHNVSGLCKFLENETVDLFLDAVDRNEVINPYQEVPAKAPEEMGVVFKRAFLLILQERKLGIIRAVVPVYTDLPAAAQKSMVELSELPNKTSEQWVQLAVLGVALDGFHANLNTITSTSTEINKLGFIFPCLYSLPLVSFLNTVEVKHGQECKMSSFVDAVDSSGNLYNFKFSPIEPNDVLEMALHVAVRNVSCGYLYSCTDMKITTIQNPGQGIITGILSIQQKSRYNLSDDDRFLEHHSCYEHTRSGVPLQ